MPCNSDHCPFVYDLDGGNVIDEISYEVNYDKHRDLEENIQNIRDGITPLFPILMNKVIIFGVVSKTKDSSKKKKISFIQVPVNIPRFFEYKINGKVYFIPIENIIRKYIKRVFKGISIESLSLFRILRNGDYTLEESEDIESNFLEELKQ